jgi:excisionase family DNA binding protein
MTKEVKDVVDKALMMTVKDVAKAMQCSDRHVTNLRKEGRIPKPSRLGASVRWPRKTIEQWIDAGCPALAV